MSFNVCRACMKAEYEEKFTSIFTENGKYSNFIFELTNLKIPNLKESPALLCTGCIHELEKSISFRNSIIRNHKSFSDFYSQSRLRSLLIGVKVDDDFDCGTSKNTNETSRNNQTPEVSEVNYEKNEKLSTNRSVEVKEPDKDNQNLPDFNMHGYIRELLTEKFTVTSGKDKIVDFDGECSLKVSQIKENFIKEEPMEEECHENHQELHEDYHDISKSDGQMLPKFDEFRQNLIQNLNSYPENHLNTLKSLLNNHLSDNTTSNSSSHEHNENDRITIKTESGDKFEIINAEVQQQTSEYHIQGCSFENTQNFPLLLSALSNKKSFQDIPHQSTSFLCQNCGQIAEQECKNCESNSATKMEVDRYSQRDKVIQKYLEDPTVTITALSRWADVPRTTVGRIIENFKSNKSQTVKRPGAGRKAGTGNVEREEKIVEVLKLHPQLTVRQLATMFGTCPANVQKIKTRHGLAFRRRDESEREEEDEDEDRQN